MSQLTTLSTADSQAESRINKYRRYREMSNKFHSKILALDSFGKFLNTACVHLGFSRVREELFAENSTDVAYVVDYAEQAVLDRGKSFLEIYRDSTAQHSPEETELLEHWIKSPVGIYRMIDADAEAGLVTAEDVTDPRNQVTMTDFGLSLSYQHNKAIDPDGSQLSFLRPVQFEDFAMCSGFICGFSQSVEREVLKLWDKYDGSVRYASIVRLFRTKGDLVVNTKEFASYLK